MLLSILLKISVIDFIEWIVFPVSFIVFILMLRRAYKSRNKNLIEQDKDGK